VALDKPDTALINKKACLFLSS